METQTKTAFAVYSADDNSLNFYKRVTVPSAGDTFDGRTATAVYTGIESDTYNPGKGYDTYSCSTVPWKRYQNRINTSTLVDDGIQPVSTVRWFCDCKYLSLVTGLNKLDTSKVTAMNSMFRNCSFLTTLDLSGWDTSKVETMGYMFSYCKSLTSVNLSGWDTSSVTSMNSMFYYCFSLTSIEGISGWDTSAVTRMDRMLDNCSKLTSLDLSKWTTSEVTNMSDMFAGCKSLTSVGDLSKWDTSNVEGMGSMFYNCNSLTSLDLSNWDTSAVTYMGNMFYGGMFQNCKSLTSVGDLSKWDTSKVEDMCYMFSSCSKLTTLDLSNWDTSKVTAMNSMFHGDTSLTSVGDLSKWNTSKVESMGYMFCGCSALTADCSAWDVKKVTDHSSFNYHASGVKAPTWNDGGLKLITVVYKDEDGERDEQYEETGKAFMNALEGVKGATSVIVRDEERHSKEYSLDGLKAEYKMWLKEMDVLWTDDLVDRLFNGEEDIAFVQEEWALEEYEGAYSLFECSDDVFGIWPSHKTLKKFFPDQTLKDYLERWFSPGFSWMLNPLKVPVEGHLDHNLEERLLVVEYNDPHYRHYHPDFVENIRHHGFDGDWPINPATVGLISTYEKWAVVERFDDAEELYESPWVNSICSSVEEVADYFEFPYFVVYLHPNGYTKL